MTKKINAFGVAAYTYARRVRGAHRWRAYLFETSARAVALAISSCLLPRVNGAARARQRGGIGAAAAWRRIFLALCVMAASLRNEKKARKASAHRKTAGGCLCENIEASKNETSRKYS
jgi:hypothetical protein